MTTVLVWLLLSADTSARVSTVERFNTAQACHTVQLAARQLHPGVKTTCIQAEIAVSDKR